MENHGQGQVPTYIKKSMTTKFMLEIPNTYPNTLQFIQPIFPKRPISKSSEDKLVINNYQ